MTSAPLIPAEPLSWEQFLELPDHLDGRYPAALINGEVVWMNPPAMHHEMVVINLLLALRAWTGPGLDHGYAVTRPLVRIAGRPLGYEADAGWFPPDQVSLDAAGVLTSAGLPAIAAEAWSPSNWASEIARKAKDYARAGVPELWGLSPEQRSVTRFAGLDHGVYETVTDLTGSATLTSPLLPGFAVEVATLFVP